MWELIPVIIVILFIVGLLTSHLYLSKKEQKKLRKLGERREELWQRRIEQENELRKINSVLDEKLSEIITIFTDTYKDFDHNVAYDVRKSIGLHLISSIIENIDDHYASRIEDIQIALKYALTRIHSGKYFSLSDYSSEYSRLLKDISIIKNLPKDVNQELNSALKHFINKSMKRYYKVETVFHGRMEIDLSKYMIHNPANRDEFEAICHPANHIDTNYDAPDDQICSSRLYYESN